MNGKKNKMIKEIEDLKNKNKNLEEHNEKIRKGYEKIKLRYSKIKDFVEQELIKKKADTNTENYRSKLADEYYSVIEVKDE
jgi:hypothetical protein